METTVANGKVALVTGSAMGIGLACAEAFAKAGYITVLADIKEPAVQAAKLVEEGYQAVAYRCDVSDTQAVEKMIAWIVATYGRLDAAHNNAGIQTPQRPMAEITDEEFDRTVAVDLKGVWNCMRYEIRQMLAQGGGAIVNTSSQGGVTGFPGQAAYIACKHAVIGLTRTAAIDYAAKGIRINAVCPGAIRTPMAEELMRRNPSLKTELVRDIPAGRLGNPEEIANAVLWLCSPQASFVDGHALLVDGAFSIH
jgi:oxidoreductase, short-chain dehydrogenase/reductase family